MKFYYYLTICVGMILLLGIAGVDGIGNNVLSLFLEDGTPVQPNTQYNGTLTDIDQTVSTVQDTSTSFWDKILLALLGMAVLGGITGIQTFGSGVSLDPQTALKGIVAYGSFGIFVSDMWSLVTLVFSFGTVWVSWLLFMIVSVFLVGFAVSCLEFVGGTD